AFSDDFPVFWESAAGSIVVDVDGNRYLDLSAAFGVANAGHANPRVTAAVADQASRLMHGMGDVHPTAVRARLLERLARIVPGNAGKAFLATTGSEAVEAALKTALLATGRSRFASFRGAYHGLSLGTLPVCGLDKFREPFAQALGPSAVFLDYPNAGSGIGVPAAIQNARATLTACDDVAALIVEPIQGRAGCIVPPDGYLTGLRELCDELDILLIADEIYTGFGRTGWWFAVDREGVVPDILCVGKALGSGFPISAAIGRAAIMDAWPASSGEALHTSTYLGNPMGCAAALATLEELETRKLPERARSLEPLVRSHLDALRSHSVVVDVRGRGLLWGVQFVSAAAARTVVERALRAGLVLLQSGAAGDAIAISPPLVISERQLTRALVLLEAVVDGFE
ncbi:MAG: aspartate aminotransferase family protein, partial [Candidatus Tumulicola sp.]